MPFVYMPSLPWKLRDKEYIGDLRFEVILHNELIRIKTLIQSLNILDIKLQLSLFTLTSWFRDFSGNNGHNFGLYNAPCWFLETFSLTKRKKTHILEMFTLAHFFWHLIHSCNSRALLSWNKQRKTCNVWFVLFVEKIWKIQWRNEKMFLNLIRFLYLWGEKFW